MTYIGCRPITFYQIEGASYNGCDGWSTWICEDFITTNELEANEKCNKMNKQSFNRYNVVEKTIIK